MLTTDFHYELPDELIAQQPVEQRDQSRLLVMHRTTGVLEHRRFDEIGGFLRPGDLLVVNDSRVIPARLRGRKAETRGEIEILLAEENAENDWWVLLRPGKRVRPGSRLQFRSREVSGPDLEAEVLAKAPDGRCRLVFRLAEDIRRKLDLYGEIPLPPYISRASTGPGREDSERYQTVYARDAGSAAAPTAGLHFTESLLERLRNAGVGIARASLHVGLGTFAPVKTPEVRDHVMHSEEFELPEETVRAVEQAKSAGRRVVAVGTTTVRILESVAAANGGRLEPGRGRTSIFIYPPREFAVVDALVTNFHLPESTLLMLVSAFAAPGETRGIEQMLNTYTQAVAERYRFFSYGDAMLIL